MGDFSRSGLALAFLVGCGAAAGPPPGDGGLAPRTSTGQVAASDALVAAIATAHSARVYFCGGASSFATLSHWFTVDLDPSGNGAVPPDAHGWSLQMHVDGGGLAGSVTAGDGVARSFQTVPVAADAVAGLYESLASPCGRIGLIVVQGSGGAPQGQGACIGPGAAGGPPQILQVNPLSPIARSAQGAIAVTVSG